MSVKTDPQAFGGDLSEELTRQEPEWRKRLESSDRFYVGLEDGGVLASFAGAKKMEQTEWMLTSVYTVSSARGRGLAQKVVEGVLEECKKRGVTRMELMVNVDQADAVYLYKKIGFEVVKKVTDQKMLDGKIHDEYVMEMKLV